MLDPTTTLQVLYVATGATLSATTGVQFMQMKSMSERRGRVGRASWVMETVTLLVYIGGAVSAFVASFLV